MPDRHRSSAERLSLVALPRSGQLCGKAMIPEVQFVMGSTGPFWMEINTQVTRGTSDAVETAVPEQSLWQMFVTGKKEHSWHCAGERC